ncbi:hypothetical protein ARSEF1564_010282 [Beauveria bassiana]
MSGDDEDEIHGFPSFYLRRGAPPLAVEPLIEYREGALVAGCPDLLRLPPELRLLTWRFADGSLLWSSSAICNIYSALSACHSEPMVMRLADVNCWARGAAAESGHVPARGLVRLTFDCRGLRRVGRLKARPAVTGVRSDFLAFVIEPAEAIADVRVTFQPTSGILVVNYLVESHEPDLYTSQQPLLLLYDKPSDDIPISIVGAYSKTAIYRLAHRPGDRMEPSHYPSAGKPRSEA